MAENSFFASAYNQIRNGRACGEVSRSDLKQAGFACGSENPVYKVFKRSWEIYEWNVFQLGAENQIHKNDCQNEQVTVLLRDKTLLKTWFSQLAAAWMGLKKSELILKKCNTELFSRLQPSFVRRYGERIAYQKTVEADVFESRKPLEKEWVDLCLDKEKMSALKAAASLFPTALPVVSDPEFFKTMEKHRKMIVNKKTGKPLTDDDLIKENLHDLSFIKLKLETQAETEIKDKMSMVTDERASITKKIRESKKDGSYHLSSSLKEYMFQDETIYQTLIENKLMGAGYQDIDNTKRADSGSGFSNDSDRLNTDNLQRDEGNKVPVSNGAFCILAKYEPTLTGEVIDFAATSAIAGGIIFKAIKGAKYVSSLSTVGKFKKSMGYGMAVTGYPIMAKQIFNSCGGNDAYTAKKVVSASKTANFASDQSSNLPDEVGYGAWNLTVDPNQIPSCKNVEDKNLMLNKNYKSNCALDSLLAVSPLMISLPVTVGVAVTN